MKCPNDQMEMEKGGLTTNGNGWIKFSESLYSKIVWTGFVFGNRVFAWKCPKCGKIELYSEEKK